MEGEWIKVSSGKVPPDKTWVEVLNDWGGDPVEYYYWSKYGFDSWVTHWRYCFMGVGQITMPIATVQLPLPK